MRLAPHAVLERDGALVGRDDGPAEPVGGELDHEVALGLDALGWCGGRGPASRRRARRRRSGRVRSGRGSQSAPVEANGRG